MTLKALLCTAAIIALVATTSCKKDQPEAAAPNDTAVAEPGANQGDETTAAPETPAAKPTEEPASDGAMTNEQKAEAGFKMIEDMVQIMVDNKGNCDAMADRLSTFLDDNAALIASGKEWDKDPEFKQLFDEKYKDRLEAVMTPMMEAMTECQANEKLKSVMQRLADE